MNWDQIEVKWAAMARRVRADLPQNVRQVSSQAAPLTQPKDLPEPPQAEVSAATLR